MRTAGFCSLLLLFVVAGINAQDEVLLEDGRCFQGVIQWETETHVALETSFGLIEFKRAQVKEVRAVTKAAEDRGERRSQGIMNLTKRRRVAARSEAADRPRAARPDSESPSRSETRPEPGPEATSMAARMNWAELAGTRARADGGVLDLPVWLKQRLGPFFPRQPQSLALLVLLLFALVVFILQVGCRFLDVESFSFSRGVIMAALVLLLLAAAYSLRAMLNTPLAGVLAFLVAFLVLAASVTALFQERAGKSTILVGFLFFFGGLSVSCILVGAAGVVALW